MYIIEKNKVKTPAPLSQVNNKDLLLAVNSQVEGGVDQEHPNQLLASLGCSSDRKKANLKALQELALVCLAKTRNVGRLDLQVPTHPSSHYPPVSTYTVNEITSKCS